MLYSSYVDGWLKYSLAELLFLNTRFQLPLHVIGQWMKLQLNPADCLFYKD